MYIFSQFVIYHCKPTLLLLGSFKLFKCIYSLNDPLEIMLVKFLTTAFIPVRRGVGKDPPGGSTNPGRRGTCR